MVGLCTVLVESEPNDVSGGLTGERKIETGGAGVLDKSCFGFIRKFLHLV